MIEGKSILVTGETGFVGSNLFRKLSVGNRMYSLCRSSSNESNESTGYIEADLRDPIDTGRLPGEIDYIIHLAAIINHKEYNVTESDLIRVNLESTLHLLEYAKNIGVKRFVFASTGGVYKEQPYPLTEEDTCCYKGLYSLTKYLCEEAVKSYTAFFKYTILRYYYPYGPGQRENRLIPKLAKMIKNHQPVFINESGGPVISPIYCSDFIEATMRAIEYEDNVLMNIGGSESKSIKEIADMIGSILGEKPRFAVKETGNSPNQIADISLLKELLGFVPEHKMIDGLRSVCEDKSMLESKI